MLKFMNRDMRNHCNEAIAQRRHQRVKGKSLKISCLTVSLIIMAMIRVLSRPLLLLTTS
jgi:hypothetical protein